MTSLPFRYPPKLDINRLGEGLAKAKSLVHIV